MKINLFIKSLLMMVMIIPTLLGCSERMNSTAGSSDISSKPTAPISIFCEVPKSIKPLEEHTIIIHLTASADVKNLAIKINPSEGLQVAPDKREIFIGEIGSGKSVTEKINLTVQKEGHYLLNLIVTGQIGGNPVVKTTAIPLSTENAPDRIQKSSGTKSTNSQGEPIIILPAEEKND